MILCDCFIEVGDDPWAGTYCKRRAGHDGDHSSLYADEARTITPAHSVQRDVEDFHRALDMPNGHTPAIRRPELRAALIEEEAKETVDAIRRGDLVEAIDGMCDVLCVVYGTAAEFGVDLAPFWDEVHRTNMAKVGGPVREDGKRLKPPGWTPPDIAGLLRGVLHGDGDTR